ncbi:hypothetical protein P167DRAFT_517996 [Morchella conica CCBAS932]|uniref:Arrestin C-terminal-like domain-containing protein n=1 Tax=Morchella conica CCBAS932 TaxID=1392247 RepID=A0A3N4KZI5_9PEZI|nr:hypothetical protein P167DRAFT_517996 [Morchella conica CCBAS932]
MMTSTVINAAQNPPAVTNTAHPGRRNTRASASASNTTCSSRRASRRRSHAQLPTESSSSSSSSSQQFYNSAESIARRIQRTPSAVAKRLFAHAVSTTSSFSSRKSQEPSQSSASKMRVSRAMGGGMSGIPAHRTSSHSRHLSLPQPISSSNSSTRTTGHLSPAWTSNSSNSHDCGSGGMLTSEKPQAATSGGAVTMTIQLAEPMLFLQGFDQSDHSNRTPAMLRGCLVLRVTKPTKIKVISLTFQGKATTEWPEGIPPKKSEYREEKEIMKHTWPFFNAQFATAEIGHCADSCRLYKSSSDSTSSLTSAIGHLARSASPLGITPAMAGSASERRLSLQLSQSRSFSKGESPNSVTVAQRGYRVFQPGDYIYNFELPLESCLPETIDVDMGSVKYELEGVIERPGAFRPNLVGRKDVTLIRCPAESSLECSEPIAISRTWEDQLHYDIVISGKSFPLGSKIPIAFKLTPLAKVRCHRIKIFITENIEYSCKNKKVHRLDPTKKVQLYEKRADGPASSAFTGSSARVVAGGGFDPSQTAGEGQNIDSGNGSDSLLGDLNGEKNIGPTEMEFSIQLPGCNAKEKDRIHFDTTYQNIQVHHWIKIVMRLSKTDPNDPTKRRHFEISIDSPFHILSCRAAGANTDLPAYDSNNSGQATGGTCSCPPLSRRNSPRDATPTVSSSRSSSSTLVGSVNDSPPAFDPNSASRPMHLIRVPSYQPPPFDHDVAPPPLVTPPPQYDSVVSNGGLADYFQRLADETAGEVSDEEDESRQATQRRLLPPLTPGGRIARSMDERRSWMPIGLPGH